MESTARRHAPLARPAATQGPGRRLPPPPPPGPIARATPLALNRLPVSAPPGRAAAMAPFRLPLGMPNLRRNVCPHFYMTGARGAIPIQAPHLLKALIRQDSTTSRCQLRGGVHMEQGYVNDVCLTPRFNQCIFYEEELTRE